jgi:glycosyltransferase involved in cell wall biosynthesis
MSIYHKEKVEYFNRAMESIWDYQTVQPQEIILVIDGILNESHYIEIEKWKQRTNKRLKTIQLKQNRGLGYALNIGLKKCSFEIVARMDADDISLPDRFQKQLQFLKNNKIDACSSWVNEFDTEENNIVSTKKVPEYHKDILSYAKKRNPINHPSVMFKKSSVIYAGGYKDLKGFEDYYLWVRMLIKEYKFYNIQEPLLNMRAGEAQITRRSGFKYALQEIDFQKRIFHLGFINSREFLLNIISRSFIRILPNMIVKKIYKYLRK